MKKFWRNTMPLLLMVALLLAVGCATKQGTAPMSAPSPLPAPAPAPGMARDAAGTAESTQGSSSNLPETDRKIIRTGQITLEVADIGKAMDEVAAIANELGGYVVSSNRSGNEDNNSGRVSIRVPANRFTDAFIKLRTIAVKVPNESTNSQDVTEEYMDLKARLRNLEATEAQFLSLLDKAKTVEEILKVQREISNVRTEIERTKGRMQYLERTTDMSLIQVNLQETKVVGKNGWNGLETLKYAVDGLIGFGKVLVDIIIWLIIFIPLWAIIWAIVFFVRRWRKKKAKSRVTS